MGKSSPPNPLHPSSESVAELPSIRYIRRANPLLNFLLFSSTFLHCEGCYLDTYGYENYYLHLRMR